MSRAPSKNIRTTSRVDDPQWRRAALRSSDHSLDRPQRKLRALSLALTGVGRLQINLTQIHVNVSAYSNTVGCILPPDNRSFQGGTRQVYGPGLRAFMREYPMSSYEFGNGMQNPLVSVLVYATQDPLGCVCRTGEGRALLGSPPRRVLVSHGLCTQQPPGARTWS